jgi:hypothetical protein
MTTLTHARRPRRPGAPAPADDERLPPRPRRRWLNPASALVLALVTCAVGFLIGVRVEKSQVGTTSSASPAAAFAGRAGAGTAAGVGTGASGAGASRGGAPAAGGFAARFSGGGASAGTVASVDGGSLVLKEVTGDTVKVKLTSATKITKATSVDRREIHPGDTISVAGATLASGAIAAASISDTGASSSGSGAAAGGSGSSSAANSGSGSGSGVGSLFSSGG